MLDFNQCLDEIAKIKTKSYCLIVGGQGTNFARSPKVWNNWKAKLLMSLFYKTNNYLLKKEEGKIALSVHTKSETDKKLADVGGNAGQEIKKYIHSQKVIWIKQINL